MGGESRFEKERTPEPEKIISLTRDYTLIVYHLKHDGAPIISCKSGWINIDDISIPQGVSHVTLIPFLELRTPNGELITPDWTSPKRFPIIYRST